ncbi:Growth_factor receptor cysteine-rich domain superfamily [Hexamita inflata]|uniref:Growth factor receptor cysteine-rich domain superfamily n=1 Tax=Hexamita inflata TaxID=28002 RepID=A0AA86QMH5_9EUKA|nr:Growth factor receptor cysteine-rich domain superfamily [Hexamita inflata]CAI9961276.1 Growth factor receptor cysteine-rich domain superfamily [Hexamita inflata]
MLVIDCVINISVTTQLSQGSLICKRCDAVIQNSTLAFVAQGTYLSGVMCYSNSSMYILDSFLQYRFTSKYSSDLVIYIDSELYAFTINNSKISGHNMMQGHLNSYLALQSLNVQIVNISNLTMCDSLQQAVNQNIVIYGAINYQCSSICSPNYYVYGICSDILVLGQLINDEYICINSTYFDGQTCVCKQELQYHNGQCVDTLDTLGQTNLNMLTNITSTRTYTQNMYDSQLTTLNTNISGTSTQFLQRYGLQLQRLASNVTAVDQQITNNNAAIMQHEANNITKMQSIQHDSIVIVNNAVDQNYTYIQNYLVGKTNALNSQKLALNVSINNNIVSNFTMLTTNLMNQISQITQKTAQYYSKIDNNFNNNVSVLNGRIAANQTALAAKISGVKNQYDAQMNAVFSSADSNISVIKQYIDNVYMKIGDQKPPKPICAAEACQGVCCQKINGAQGGAQYWIICVQPQYKYPQLFQYNAVSGVCWNNNYPL